MFTNAGIQMFMDKLNHLINGTHNPYFNNTAIIRERPQFQLLYDELGSMIQTLFMDQHIQELEIVNDLKKKRFTDAAEEAEYIVDLFLSDVHKRNDEHDFPTTYHDFNPSLNLDDVRIALKSLEVEFKSMRIDSSMKMGGSSQRSERTQKRNFKGSQNRVDRHFPKSEDLKRYRSSLNLDDVMRSFKSVKVEFMGMRIAGMKMGGSSQRPLNQPAQISSNSPGSKKLLVVGLDSDAKIIRDKLVEDQKKVDVVSVVGMGGIGKTTLATKVFNDGYVKHHFHVRVWVTVSQTYDRRCVLIQILESIRCQLDLEKASDYGLREMVHKHLMGKRYLIVIDDIWHIETWDNLKLFFPHDNTGSRILLTSRLTEVAKHANSDGLVYHLRCLSKEKSWELLCQKVFHGNEYPEWSIKPGMQIVENCQGLPLAVVVIAGVLAKQAWSEKFWVKIAYSTGSYIIDEENGCLETLGLSYNHLPLHLRKCFLYLGGFPEDYKFKVQRLTWLWVAEGFIEQAGKKSLEDIAEGYLMDLIDRNLVIVSDRSKSNGAVKACILHDLVRELCQRKAKEERFILQTERLILSSQFGNVITPLYKPVRMFISKDINILGLPYPSTQNTQSILLFSYLRSLNVKFAEYLCSFVLLRVLDLQSCSLNDFPKGMELLVHLRYLAIWNLSADFPSSVCNLWSLQTLIYTSDDDSVLPSNISDLVNLRHLWTVGMSFSLPSIGKPMNLQTISDVVLKDGVDNLQKCFPCIKELTCTAYLDEENDYKSLTCLKKLKFTGMPRRMKSTVHDSHITFPVTLKTLTLSKCHLPWSDMSIIQSLPNLEVLKLGYDAFEGSCWNTDEQEFRRLKFLRLGMLDIKLWEAYSTSFPCLKRLEILDCKYLEEIPLEIGDIPMLELIQIYNCSHSAGESLRRIEAEQHNWGHYDLKIHILEDK